MLEFMNDMAARYAWADLCICRSGAMTVTEMAIAKPAIFVPFPPQPMTTRRTTRWTLVEQKALAARRGRRRSQIESWPH